MPPNFPAMYNLYIYLFTPLFYFNVCNIISDLVTFPADQEFWINVDDDAYEPDFDGNFAKVYDSSCEPCMNYNPLEFMKYEAREEP